MAIGLLDIAPKTEEVSGVTVKGVSARGVSYLMAIFPELRMALTGIEFKLTPERIMLLAPSAIAAIIACGCGFAPDGTDEGEKRQAEAEAKAGDLPVGVQLDFIEAILKATMPGGAGPFVAKLERLAKETEEGFGKVAVTKSPPQSPNAVAPGLEPPQSVGS